MKSSDFVSLSILIGLMFGIMGWYASRSDVPEQKPVHVSRQYFT